MTGPIDMKSRRTAGESQMISLSEDEEDLVSSEELKHEMSAEKGLAWFDLGNGRIVKGRSFWFNAELPESWEGREFLTKLEKFENDELGLADWVDEQILSQERKETSAKFLPKSKPQENIALGAVKKKEEKTTPENTIKENTEPEKSGPFKINLFSKAFRPKSSVNTFSKAENNGNERKNKG